MRSVPRAYADSCPESFGFRFPSEKIPDVVPCDFRLRAESGARLATVAAPASGRLRPATFVCMAVMGAAMVAPGSAQNSGGPPAEAQRQVVKYVAELGNLHCKESVVQEKLSPTGHVVMTEHSMFDYLVMIQGNKDDFELNESRLETKAAPHKQLPMLVTNGFSTLLLIFHPYYSQSFEFEPLLDESINGTPVSVIRFKHIRGQRSVAALALRNREYPLELQGTAWLNKKTGQVLRMDATLEDDMSDIGLRSLRVHVDYGVVHLGAGTGSMTLPLSAKVELTTPRQHWRNTHVFTDYKVFGAEAEQDPHVKLKADNQDNSSPGTSQVNVASKENH